MTKCKLEIIQSQYRLAKITPIEECNYETIEINIADFKVFHNDIIEFDFESKTITKIIETDITNIDIVGVLVLRSNHKYGFNKRKFPIYLFKPFDFRYPDFLVASGVKRKNNVKENQFAVIRYNKWERKIPNGMIRQIIGSVGEIIPEYNAILHKYNFNKNPPKLKQLTKKTRVQDIFNIEDFYDIRELEIISIDPPNCTDIDDALSLEEIDTGYKIGIHIANVSAFTEKFDLFEKIVNRCTTVYGPHKKINMIPNILSDNLASLLEGKERLSLTLWIYLNNQFEIIDYKFQECILINKKAFSYKEAKKSMKKNNLLKQLYNISQKLANNINYNINDFDVHKMIEVYMILANHITAKYLIENKSPCIFRTHKSKEHEIDFNTIDEKLSPFLKIFQSNAAEYTTEQGHYYHYGLDLNKYTHFTSPIRRLPDIIIHMLIKNLSIPNIEQICMNCNNISKKIKKMDRDFTRINIVKNTDTETVYQAYILSINENTITIYCPELKFCDRIYLFDQKMSEIINIEKYENTLILTNKLSNKTIKLNLYQKIKVKMIGILGNISMKNKLIVKILEPNIESII
jgi:exoribonuclease R